MSTQVVEYSEVRSRMKPGDIIAFAGTSDFSELIKWMTRSSVSHIGILLQSKLLIGDTPQEGFFNQIIESATINGFSGVSINRLSDRIHAYDGQVWWLPLSDEARERLNEQAFYNFLLHQEKKEYDLPQALCSAGDQLERIPLLGKITHNVEDFTRFFCSELAAAGLEQGGVIDNINASEVTPVDMCRFNIYQRDYYQIKGLPRKISGYNSLDPTGWGE